MAVLARGWRSAEEVPTRSEQESEKLTWRGIVVRLPAPFHCPRCAAHMRALALGR
jgi:hypothetical protein